MKKTYTKHSLLFCWSCWCGRGTKVNEGHCCNVIRPHVADEPMEAASALIPASILIPAGPPVLSSSSPDVHDEHRGHSHVLLF